MPPRGDEVVKRETGASSRRKLLQGLGVAGTASLAGCPALFGGDGSDGLDVEPVELYGPSGERVTPTLYYQADDPQSQSIAQQVKNNLANIGVDLQLESRPRNQLLAEDFASEPLPDENPAAFEYGPVGRNAGPPDRTRTTGDWDMLIGIVANSYPRTPDNTDSFWTRDGQANAYGYVPSTDHESLYAEFGSTTDPDEQQAALNEVFGNLSEDLPGNFLSQSKEYFAFRENINTSEEFTDFGYTKGTLNRYRDQQSVGQDFVWISTTPLTNLFVPEIDDGNSTRRFGLVSDPTYDVTPDNEIYPLLMDAEDAGDSQVFVFTLRDNLQFGTDAEGNDYGQMTAEDWVYQTRFVHGVADDASDRWNEQTPPSAQIGDYEQIERVEQTGELEFQVELPEPDPVFLFRPVLWGAYCLPKAFYEAYAPDAQAARQAEEITQLTWTGNLGPYSFESRTSGVAGSFTASRNDDYYMRDHVTDSNVRTVDDGWADAPFFERYQFDNESDQSVATERFRNGDGSLYIPPSDAVEEFRQSVDDVRVEGKQFPFISVMFFNQRSNGDTLTRTRAGRQASALVVDKETISNEIQRGLTTPTSTFQPTWSEYYNEDAVTEYGIGVTEEDVRQARDLLRESEPFSVESV
ncbi:ABC transporter substrate-binding protein [Halorientalis sp.]|uniref:ABC transporter substrate-binding protein n=1 Tax=Halorientalis sp. TaxID=1931229 RepID=UPI00263774AE|nr:ABC transporter substrate-binding protein [Halorientalis sp.]